MNLLTPTILVCNEEYWLPYVLEASRGHFQRYVIYDVGSTDATKRIIEWFRDTSPDVEFSTFFSPMVPPEVQGKYRNSMIVEARSPYYLILDGDEIYTPQSYSLLHRAAEIMHSLVGRRKLYGIVRRQEWTEDLTKLYGVERQLPHHRIYHRDAIWRGTHPGERPFFPQRPDVEHWFPEIVCHHMHNAARSSRDACVPGRAERKAQATYRRGTPMPAQLFEELPLLRRRIESFAVAPVLAELQSSPRSSARMASENSSLVK